MTDDMLAAQVNKVTNYNRMIIQLNQSFSAGFIDDLRRPRRILYASAGPAQPAYAHPSGYFGHFNFWLLSAHYGKNLLTNSPVNADADHDGRLSIVEAYNLARQRTTGQYTMYEDNGVVPYRPGNMPAYGEGAAGSAIRM